MDASLLQIVKHRKHYDSLIPELPEEALDVRTMKVIRAFGTYFKGHPSVETIDMEAFKVYFFNFSRSCKDEDIKLYYNKMLNNCVEDADEEQVAFMSHKLLELKFATHVGNAVQQYNDGDEIEILHEIGQLYEETSNLVGQHDSFTDEELDIDEILEADEHRTGIRFHTRPLCDGLRPMQSGDFIIVAGRPDSGKTSFLASQLLTFTETMASDRCILWLNNEGTSDRIIKRIYQSILDADTADLLKYRSEGTLKQHYKSKVLDPSRIKVRDCHDWTAHRVEQGVKYYNPGLVIFDMIDNITFPSKTHQVRTDQILESMYQWARVLGVKYDFPVIATSQVSAEAELLADTRMWPAQHMLKDSKTGKQGAADVIVMIGRSQDPTLQQFRYISTPKNKLAVDESYLKADVSFYAKKARYI